MTEVYKIVNGIAPPIMNSLFNFCDSIHNIRNFQDRQVTISNLSAFFSEKGLTADFCRVESSRKESRKLPVPSRNFGLETCDIIITSSEPQKLIFLLWSQSKVIETIVNDSFSWGTTKTTFSIKIDTIMTSHNSEWGLVTSSDLENTLLWFKVKTKTSKSIKAIVFQVNLQKPFF